MAEKLGPIEEKRPILPNWRRIVAVAMLGLALSGCGSGFKEGDVFVAEQTFTVVEDWNAPFMPKPTCEINKGERVTVTGFSTLWLGSSQSERLIGLEDTDCRGWYTLDSNLKKLLKKKQN